MSRIREIISLVQYQSTATLYNSIENSLLVTPDRLLIENNKALLPQKAIGDIHWNLALIFASDVDNVIIAEAQCTTDGTSVIFDANDSLNGNYCIVSYLGEKIT